LLRLSPIITLSVCAISLTLSCREAPAGVAIAPPGSGSNSATAESWVAGAHAGYNWQQGLAVFGFATDLQATHLSSSMSGGLTYRAPPNFIPPATDGAATTGLVDWYGTVRGVLGVANGPLMIYGTAGLAYGHVSLASHFSTAGLTLNSLVSEIKTGWVAGVGFEYLLLPNLSLGLLYQYVDLGGLNLAASSPPAFVTIAQTANTTGRFQAVMAGISWRFASAGSAAPWGGAYAGIQGGGAWGNSASANYAGSVAVPSDVRLKRDVTLVGRRSDGLGVYTYKYLWSDAVYVGVLAQEVALIHPGAVVHDDLTGYLSVDYGLLNGR